MKRCSKCGEEKELGEFHRRKASKDGLAPLCKDCKASVERERYLRNQDRERERSRQHYAENRKAISAYWKQRRLDNLEEFRAKGRKYAALDREGAKRRMDKWLADPANVERKRQKDKEWRERNRARKAAADRRWVEENPERRREIQKRWRINNPEKAKQRYFIDRARAGGTSVNRETRDYVSIIVNDPCAYCGEPMEHIDHIAPLAKGGGSNWDNLTAACGRCNVRKHTKPLLHALLDRSSGGVEPSEDLAA